ncbi:MAG: chromosome segregation protein SMC, partial [Oscillospiraceae bacterium]
VRLKDICELFMDTGLGRDGYSIIGQGRVAEIVSAKSNERREIFEEAAGISKFRYKKAEAERRLEAAQDNILRLKDIINELEVRVEPLKIQSEKAAKFIEFSERRKTLEISVWNKKLDDLKVNLQELEDKILVNDSQYENIDSDILRSENEIQEIYKSMQNCNARVDTLQTQILETERLFGKVNADIAVSENDVSHAKESIKEILLQKDSLKLTENDINSEIISQKELIENINLEKIAAGEKIVETRQNLDALMSESDNFNKDFEECSIGLNQLYIKQSECNFSISSAEKSVEDLTQQLNNGISQDEQLKNSLDDYKNQDKDVVSGLELIEEKLLTSNNKIGGFMRLFESKAGKLDTSKKAYEQVSMLLKEKQQRAKLLSDLENNMEGFTNSVKEVIKAAKTSQILGIRGSVAQLIHVESKYSVAIETALGAALQNVVVESEETAKRCIRLLKERNSGRATFLPITSVKGYALSVNGLENENGFVSIAADLVKFDSDYSGIILSLLGRTVIAEDIDMATIISKKYGYKFKIVTLDGQVINAGGSFTGGSNSRSSGVLTRKNEINDLNIQAGELAQKMELLKAEMQKLQAEVDKLGFDIEGIKEEISVINSDKIRFETEKKHLDISIEQTSSQIGNISKQILLIRQKILDEQKNAEVAKENLDKCVEEIAKNETIISENSAKKDNLHKEREEFSARLSQLKINEMELSKDYASALQKLSQLEENVKSLSSNATEFDLKISEQEKIIALKERQIAERKAQITQSQADISAVNEQIKKEQEIHRNFEQKSTELRTNLKGKNDEKEKYSREVTRLEERKISVQKDYDGIVTEMWEQYQLSRSEAAEAAVPLENMLAAQKELNEIKSKIKNLGTVNVAAIEEYKEVSARYKFMSEQLSDIETSKKELEKLIGDLTDDMRKRFSESFNQINENFKSIFVELFGGGKAGLILTNPDDVLESGIEINVAPPGKVIKSLSLLSGGEQAFVAIAIYFAILKIRPAPFCILDEIEAALDDVNVSKYAQYLRNFTSTTQFILVTHRRGTMEEADVLYGVTMQEKGISKLLKMDHGDTIEGRN